LYKRTRGEIADHIEMIDHTCRLMLSRRVSLAGITRHPDQAWMQQMARNATGQSWGLPDQRRYALRDRDTKFCPAHYFEPPSRPAA
jgi:hypothetical protein